MHDRSNEHVTGMLKVYSLGFRLLHRASISDSRYLSTFAKASKACRYPRYEMIRHSSPSTTAALDTVLLEIRSGKDAAPLKSLREMQHRKSCKNTGYWYHWRKHGEALAEGEG